MQSKHPPKKSTRRGHKRSTSRGTRKHQTEHQERCRKTPLGDSLSTAKLTNFGCPCRRVRFAKNPQSETTKGAPGRPGVLPKRSTSKSNQRAQMKHQKVESETTKGAPERPEVLPKRSTSKSNQRAQMNEAPESTTRDHKKEHQRDQRFCQNGAPARPIREHK